LEVGEESVNGVPVGAHVDPRRPVEEALARGADLVQIFLTDPQSWKKPPTREDAAELRASPVPIYVHAPYLINVAAEASRIRIPSRRILQESCDAAAEIGAFAVVVHGGHLTGEWTLADTYPRWRKALLEIDSEVPVLIENTAGGHNAVARRVESIARLWEEVGDLGPGFVLDTCHAWAGGEPSDELVERVLLATGRIDLVHCNDSRDTFDSRRDRHANLGRGQIPPELLAEVVAKAGAPVVVETPGSVDDHVTDIAFVRQHTKRLKSA
jgi:deoxyribonuclease-4